MSDLLTSQTFKVLLGYVFGLICDAVAKRYGYGLNAEALAGITATVIAFIAGRQFKSSKIEVAKVTAEAAKDPAVVTPAASPAAALLEASK